MNRGYFRRKPGNRAKYGNIRCKCQLGHDHDSKKEKLDCDKFALLLRGGAIEEFHAHIMFPLFSKHSSRVGWYEVDFLVKEKGKWAAYDSKGMQLSEWKLKANLFVDNYPNIPLYYSGPTGRWVRWDCKTLNRTKNHYTEVIHAGKQSSQGPEEEKAEKEKAKNGQAIR